MKPKTGASAENLALERALTAVRQAKARLKAHQTAQKEPLAIIGMGCRFPGSSNSPREFWRCLQNHKDGIVQVPKSRWDHDLFYSEDTDSPGLMRFREAGFIDEVDGFEPYFFGISPREAANMDPQQRLFLQVAWEALEDAGLPAENLCDSETGVFVGANNYDYFHLQLMNPDVLDTYSVVGSANSIIANRLSYFLDLRGPSMVIDTACSSSLTAVHLACQSLRSGECELAIAGGLNVILSPFAAMAHAKGFPMAADARCRTFDAQANGYVRGEGCGVVVLKRYGDAVRDGDGIWATIRGSAVNQDGKTNGLMAPNGLSQQNVIRKALKNAGMEAGQVSLIEAHGTATELGDPIEVEAIQEVYRAGRSQENPCFLGSVKTHIGHLEGAAGIAGLMKLALSLHHRAIPPNLHFQKINPLIALDEKVFKVPVTSHEWRGPGPRAGAVSAFGAGGSNAHVVLEEAPAQSSAGSPDRDRRSQLLLLSARTPAALRDLSKKWQTFLERDSKGPALYEWAYNAAIRRSHFEYRLAVAGATARDWSVRLGEILADPPTDQNQPASGEPHKILFLFPGQGSQWPGMGRTLYDQEPVFREAVDRCAAAAQPFIDWSLVAALQAGPERARFDEIDVVQPCLWAMGVALAELWRSWGIEPDLVAGISMGEVAAATVAGALSLADGARVICLRSQLLKDHCPRGMMAMTALPRDQTQTMIHGLGDSLSVAISYSPRSTVISGNVKDIQKTIAVCSQKNIFCKAIAVSVPSHGPLMDPLCSQLPDLLRDLRPRNPRIPFFSMVTGALSKGGELNGAYWSRNLREPVLFADHFRAMLPHESNTLVEVSPHPLLLAPISQNLEACGKKAVSVASLQKDRDARAAMLENWGALYHEYQDIQPAALFPKPARARRLPTYAWQNEPFWFLKGNRRYQWESSVTGTRPTNSGKEGAPLYRLVWKSLPPLDDSRIQPANKGFLLVTDHPLAGFLESEMARRGVRIRVLRPDRVGDIQNTVREFAKEGPYRGVILFPAQEPPTEDSRPVPPPNAYRAAETLRWIQALKDTRETSPKLSVVTSGAETRTGRNTTNLHHAPVWGLGRVLALEYPSVWGGLIDIPRQGTAGLDPGIVDSLCKELLAEGREDQILLRDGRWAARIERYEPKPNDHGPLCRDHASYLLSGPENPWSLHLARFLKDRGARRILVLDTLETRDADGLREKWAGLAAADVMVEWVPPEPQALGKKIKTLEREGFPIKGVICTGSPLRVVPTHEIDGALLINSFQRETAAPWLLHTVLGERSPDFFVLFSSAASVWGSSGVAHHGAGHHFLDSLAHARHAEHRPALCINWVPWMGCGMVPPENEKSSVAMGVFPWQPEAALAILDTLMHADAIQVTAAEIDWSLLKPVYEAKHPRPLFEAIDNLSGTDQPSPKDAPFKRRLQELTHAEAGQAIASLVGETLAAVLGFATSESVNREQGFFQLGMDSIMAVQLRRRLERETGLNLPLTLAFEYPTLDSLARFITESLIGAPPREKEETPKSAEKGTAWQLDLQSLSEQELLAMISNELENGSTQP